MRKEVIQTDGWNPLIFAIYFDNIAVVKYILKQTDTQQLYYLLSDPFKVDQEESEPDPDNEGEGEAEFLLERSEVVPLIICLITKNTKMFEELWNQPLLWCK